MGALYKCQTNYQCSESLIDLIISSGILYYFIIKAKIMFEKNNGILLLIDKALCVIAIIQMVLQVIYFIIQHMVNQFKMYGIDFTIVNMHNFNKCYFRQRKTLVTIQCSSIGNLFDWIILAKSGHKWIQKECVFYCGKTKSYQCNEISNLYLSFIGLILAIVAFVFGFQCVHQLYQYKEYLLDNKNDSFAHQILKLETRLVQIRILKISGLLQFGLQFTWDSLAYFLSTTTLDCAHFYSPISILTVLIYSLLKIISLVTIPVAIFIVCYECNKEFFGSENHIWNLQRSHRSLKLLQDCVQLNYIEMSEIK
ncbi:unnamed protein product [Paramecium sonneborni]|uniref:Uncharacterized protein n=1 Tax=Paramecium sonneborni TaxID=65129 RepID=A0A8S1MZ35_9CILI|nr:unnamed protein product [Paramecium sonneborni]